MRTRWLGRAAVALALALVACGGSARSGAKTSGGAGAPTSTGSESSGAPSGGGGAPSGVGGAGGAAPSCGGFDCLANAELIYQPTRTWHAPAGPPAFNELAEADYTPQEGATIAVRFSGDNQLQLMPIAGGAIVTGMRDAAHTDRAWYELDLFAGGRFVVQAGDPQFTAEYTVYGSGSPIISSTRGVLKNSP